METEVKVGRRDAALVMSRRMPVRLSGIGEAIGGAFQEVYGHLGRAGVQPAGPPFIIYHGVPSGDQPFDIEVCAPIARTAAAPEGWQVQELPAGTFATLVHVGPYDTVGSSYEAISAWIGAHGFVVAGPPREVYLSPPTTPPDQIRTIIEFPVSEAVAPVAAG